MSLVSGGGRFVRLWCCRLLSVPLGEQAWGRRWDCSDLGHEARRCFGTKWYSDVPGARSTRDGDTGYEDDSSFAGFLNLTNMPYSVLPWHVMTCGLACNSDKFKITTTHHRAQKFWDKRPYKNFDFLFDRLTSYKAQTLWRMSLGSGGGRFVRLWRCRLLSVPLGEQASGRRWDCSGLGNGTRRCFGTKWYSDGPGARSTRDGDTGNEDDSSFAGFSNLTNAMFSFAMGLASDSDKFNTRRSYGFFYPQSGIFHAIL